MSHQMITENYILSGRPQVSMDGTRFTPAPDMLISRHVSDRHGWASPGAAIKHWKIGRNGSEVSPGVWRDESKHTDTYQLTYFTTNPA